MLIVSGFTQKPQGKQHHARVPRAHHVLLQCALLVTRAGLAAALIAGAAFAQPAYQPLASDRPLQDANFYVLTLVEATPAARAAIAGDPAMAAATRALTGRTARAAAACEAMIAAFLESPATAKRDPACTVDAVRWTAEERAGLERAAGETFDRSPALETLVRAHLRPSNRFALHAALDDRALFVKAMSDATTNIDRIIRVYGLGERPYFADIDSVIYPIDSQYYQGLLANLVRETAMAADAERDLPWSAPLRLAHELMIANRRDDAVRMAALEDLENAAAAARLRAIRWADWRYPAILVPGHSPEIAYEPLNPNAKLRLRRGVELYREGVAPVIIVSGGTLRPVGTSFNEALEMKKHLVAEHGVPADAILIDPVARHTTTNMRNAVRLLERHGAPLDRPSVVVGNSVPYIASQRFRDRCLKELGYLPFTPGRRLSFEALEFTPALSSLHRDASDPMDP